MLGMLGGLFSGAWRQIALIGAIVFSVLIVLLRVRNAGKQAERLAQAERNARARKSRKEVEHEVRSIGGPAAVDRLRERWSRD